MKIDGLYRAVLMNLLISTEVPYRSSRVVLARHLCRRHAGQLRDYV
jgi:hypothetical protein